MFAQLSIFRRWRALAAGLTLVAAFGLVPVAAQTSSDSEVVSVQAEITVVANISMTICDTTANFGTGLTASGSPVSGTTDTVTATSVGQSAGQGVFYVWEPSCQTTQTGKFLTIDSNVPWQVKACSTESTGTSASLRIANQDLRFSSSKEEMYGGVLINGTAFTTCASATTFLTSQSPGVATYSYWYYLQVDPSDTGGTFLSTTTWTVTP